MIERMAWAVAVGLLRLIVAVLAVYLGVVIGEYKADSAKRDENRQEIAMLHIEILRLTTQLDSCRTAMVNEFVSIEGR